MLRSSTKRTTRSPIGAPITLPRRSSSFPLATQRALPLDACADKPAKSGITSALCASVSGAPLTTTNPPPPMPPAKSTEPPVREALLKRKPQRTAAITGTSTPKNGTSSSQEKSGIAPSQPSIRRAPRSSHQPQRSPPCGTRASPPSLNRRRIKPPNAPKATPATSPPTTQRQQMTKTAQTSGRSLRMSVPSKFTPEQPAGTPRPNRTASSRRHRATTSASD